MARPVIGRYAPMPRPTARRLSDLAPYARLTIEPDQWDRLIGRICAVLLVVVLVLLAVGVL